MHKILIVDDDPALVDFLRLLLESEGYDIAEAADGQIALREMDRFGPEVVLLDYMMPNMDGLDVLRRVSQDYDSSFVVMLTGKGSEEVAVECMRAGAVDYVVKPFDNERLLSVIRNAIRFRESELEKRRIHSELQDSNHRLQQYVSQLEKNSQEWNKRRSALESILRQALEMAKSLQSSDSSGGISKISTLLAKALDELKD